MMGSLYIAATGMRAQQQNLDVTANNLANVNTTGFKRMRSEFQDLHYQIVRSPGTPNGGDQIPTGIQVGMGVREAGTSRLFSQGDVQQTDNPLDLDIEGDGFFQVTQSDGTLAYTRSGSLQLNSQGQLVTVDGQLISPGITVPAGASKINITSDGTVSATVGNAQSVLGQIQLARFINPAGLESVGNNLYIATPASGDPQIGAPGSTNMGTLAQGAVEMSNVKVVDEMVNMITAMRSYEAISKTIQTSDEMLGLANNVKR